MKITMHATSTSGSEWLWGSLVVMCVLLQTTSALDDQMALDKRIFCNFEGCHNKRASDVDGLRASSASAVGVDESSPKAAAVERLFKRLFPRAEQTTSNDQARYVDVSRPWSDVAASAVADLESSLGTDELILDPAVVRALIRKLLETQRARRGGNGFMN